MNRIIKLFAYYVLILLGLVITSWIIWSRFIRERIIRDVPDSLFTEYRFWILFYICCIYLYAIKNILIPKKKNIVITEIFNIIYKPLKTLDHAIKYNKYIKPYYYKNCFDILTFITNIFKVEHDVVLRFVFCMQILPRIILVLFLLADTFYYHKLEHFYKVVLIGLLPFIFNYLIYCIKDIYEQWILDLENNYIGVRIFEEEYEFDDDRKGKTEAIYHHEKKTIREYIEIKYENSLEYYAGKIKYQYNAQPSCSKEYISNFIFKKYKKFQHLNAKDLLFLEQLYNNYMPIITNLRFFFFRLEIINDNRIIKGLKLLIFFLYLICWAYILIISYVKFPIEFIMTKHFLINFMIYLLNIDNPFAELYWGSLNKNLITIESIKYILIELWKKY